MRVLVACEFSGITYAGIAAAMAQQWGGLVEAAA